MNPALPAFSAEESARLTQIWDRLYELYLERVNGDRPGAEIDTEIESLIQERNRIRSWAGAPAATGRTIFPTKFSKSCCASSSQRKIDDEPRVI